MGTEGMKASLISREVIADSIELVARGNLFDGIVCIAGCDKNMPGTIMALARLDIPGHHALRRQHRPGRLAAARRHGTKFVDITILNVFEAIGSHAAGRKITDDSSLEAVEAAPAPAPEPAEDSSPPTPWPWPASSSASRPSTSPASPPCRLEEGEASREAGRMIMDLCKQRRRAPATSSPANRSRTPSPPSAPPAAATNAVLHLIAIAREIEHPPRTCTTSTSISEQHPLHLRPLPRRQVRRQGLSRRRRIASPRRPPQRARPATRHPRPSPARPSLRKPREAVETPGQPVIRDLVRSPQADRRPRHHEGQPLA